MAIQEKQFQSGLPELLTSLFGTKTKSNTGSTVSSSANTAPLQQVFTQASQPMDQAMYDSLVGGIFGNAALQVPELTAALANATGSRSSNNSPLALALNEQNNMAGKQAAQAIMQYNQNNAQIASGAAKGIADSTRSQTSTGSTKQTQGAGADPLTTTLLGFGLNQFDKRGGLDKVGSMISSGFDSLFGGSDAVNLGTTSDYTGLPTYSGGGADTSFFSNFDDAASGASDFFSGVSDFGSDFVSSAGDFLGDIGSGVSDFAGDAWGAASDFFGFANGGMPGQGQGLLRGRTAAPMAVADRAVAGGDPNQLMQQLLLQAMMPQMQAAPAPNPMNFLRYLLPTSNFNISQYADGGRVGPRMYPRGGGYADGGVVRNRNNMGAPQQRTGRNVVNADGMQINRSQNGPGPAGGAGGVGGNSVTSSNLMDMVARRSNEMDQSKFATGQGPGAISDARAADIANFNAADNFATRDRTLAAFASLAAGIAAPTVLGPEAAQVLGMTGLTKSPVAALNEAIQAAIVGNANVGRTNALNASSPVGGAVAVGGPANEGMSVSPDSVDAMGLTPNMSTVMAPSLLSYSVTPTAEGGVTGDYGGYGSDDGADSAYGGANTGPSSGSMGSMGGSGSSSSGGGSFGGGSGGMGDANGGLLRGPGTGTSDSIRAKSRVPGEKSTWFSDGEFIMSKDAVDFYGADFFQRLLDQVHTPVRR